jgi:hypothetical protein
MPDSFEFEIDDDEKAALIELLQEAVERDRFLLSPRVARLRGILAKLGVGSAPAMHYAAPKPLGKGRMALAKEARTFKPTEGEHDQKTETIPGLGD